MIGLRNQFRDRFAALPGVVASKAYDGRFDAEDLARAGAKASPVVHVAFLGADVTEEHTTEDLVVDGKWVAVVVVKRSDAQRDPDTETGGDVAALVAMNIVYELERTEFSEACGRANRIEAGNLHSQTIARRGHAMWAVTWRQRVRVVRPDLTTPLPDLLEIRTEFDANPEPAVVLDLQTRTGAPIQDRAGATITIRSIPTPPLDAVSEVTFP